MMASPLQGLGDSAMYEIIGDRTIPPTTLDESDAANQFNKTPSFDCRAHLEVSWEESGIFGLSHDSKLELESEAAGGSSERSQVTTRRGMNFASRTPSN